MIFFFLFTLSGFGQNQCGFILLVVNNVFVDLTSTVREDGDATEGATSINCATSRGFKS